MVARQLTAATHFPGQFPARQTGTGEQCSPLQEFFDSLRGCFTSPKKKDRSCKAFFGFTTSVFYFKLIVVNKKTQKQKQHIEILEKSQQLKFRMPTEIRISKHNALYQASIQLEGLDYTKLYRAYSGIRKSQIEPRVLFKVLVCAYMKGVYSSCKIEELCRENLVFRWLLEDQKTPDHCTIARFRSNSNLQEAFEDLFFQYVKKLEDKGYTEHSEVFVDGTKIESKANRYTFVWLKQVSKQLEKIKARLKELVCPQGNLTSTKVEKRLEQLNAEIEAQGIEVKKGRGHHKPEIVRERDELALLYRRWMEYNRKKAICGENRNSYSKTDTDATFIHMKDDHMRNGQLKPGYNVQFAVNSGFITGIGVFSNRTDFGTLIPFLTYLWHKHGKSYRNVVADSGYESLANYRWLFENGQTAFIKPANYESGKKRSSKEQVGRMENMGYYEPDDCFICKNGRHLDLSSHYTSHAKDGTERKISVYRCEDCSDCPYRAACCKAKDSEKRKEIFVCWEFQNLRNNSYHNITTEEGKLLRCNRSIQAEGAFGQLKHNRNFKRFLTGGKVKVLAELLFLGLSQNIAHLLAKCNSGLQNLHLIQPKAYLNF